MAAISAPVQTRAAPKPRRTHGSGCLYLETRGDGRRHWYGRWYAGSRRLNRLIGLKREPGSSRGLTKTEADAELRRMMLRHRPLSVGEEITFGAAAELMLSELEEIGRKETTLDNYRQILSYWLLPRFGEMPLNRIPRSRVEALATEMLTKGKAAQTRSNILKLLSQIFSYGRRNRWCETNPCWGVRRPRIRPSQEIHYLDKAELEAVISAIDVTKKPFGSTDRAIILTAAMTGMRQGELLALRWQDVDWQAKRIRIRRNYTRGHWSTPKSRSGERSVPMATRVSAELRQLRERSPFDGEDDLVFAHSGTGDVLNHAPLVRRFKRALKQAGARPIRFHDLRHTFGTRMAASPMWRCATFRSGWDIGTTERP